MKKHRALRQKGWLPSWSRQAVSQQFPDLYILDHHDARTMACLVWITAFFLARGLAATSECSVPLNSFCSGTTYPAVLPLPASELDAAARSDYELALGKLQKVGGSATQPMCLEAWKALQCASKFQRCFSTPSAPYKVCRSLCVQFALACNGSEAVLTRCNDDLLYDEPPCTDYAELVPSPWLLPSKELTSSPVELFHTAAGLPLLVTLLVLALHTLCCGLQHVFGSRFDDESAALEMETPREAVRLALAKAPEVTSDQRLAHSS